MILGWLLVVALIVGGIARHRFLKKLSKEQQALQVVSDSIQNMVTHTVLSDVVRVVYGQLASVGIEFHTLTIHHVLDAETGQCHAYEMGMCGEVVERTFRSARVVALSRAGEVTYRPNMYKDSGGLDARILKRMEERQGKPVCAILDIAHARGLLSLHSSKLQGFSSHQIAFAKRIGEYISLGISRAEDIKNLQDALHSARKLAHTVEQSPVSVVITDLQGNIEYVNPKFEQVTGYTYAEVIGRNPRMLKSGELPPEEYKRLWEIIRKGETWRGEFHNVKKNGDLYWEAASISGVHNEVGEVTHYVAVKEDITKKKEMEAALLAAERDQVLAETAGAAAHEINQPLTVILGLTQLLINSIPDGQFREDLVYIEKAGKAIKQIVSKMAQTDQYETKEYVGEAQIVDFSTHKSVQ